MNINESNITYLWYDLETFGLNSHYDRIAQFAAIRTDLNFNQIGDSIVYYCKLSSDYIPSIEACLVTGITPQECEEKGTSEEEFIKKINAEFSEPNTIVVGFNSMKFDDEFVRNTLYRNLMDPYKREWENGCSRWDIIDLVRATHDLRPEGINWPPKKEDNTFSFKLTELTEANNIEQIGAHDALVDVRATINVAKLIKTKQPKLYNWSLNLRNKKNVEKLIIKNFNTPLVHTNTRLTTEYGCTSLVIPICESRNAVYAFDLTKDIDPLYKATAKNIFEIDGLIKISYNRCPFISPATVLFEETAQRLNIDKEEALKKVGMIKRNRNLEPLLIQADANKSFKEIDDVDFKIYSGFFNFKDKKALQEISLAPLQKKLDLLETTKFNDDRAKELVYRYIYRNNEDSLNDFQKLQWYDFCWNRITNPPEGVENSLESYKKKIDEFLLDNSLEQKEIETLHKLKDYAIKLEQKLTHKEK